MTKERLRVLVAEDEPLLAEIIGWALEDEGFAVQIASNGDEALRIFDAESHDLLITDIRMPGRTDGWALAAAIRVNAPKIPVVFMSGYSPDAPRLPDRSAFVQKPFPPEDLLTAIQGLREASAGVKRRQ